MARAGAKVPPMKKEAEVKQEMKLSSVQLLVKVDIYEGDKKIGEGFIGPTNGQDQQPFEFYNVEDAKDFFTKLPKMLHDAANGKVPK